MTTLGRFGAPPSVPDRTAADWLPAVVVIAVNLALAMILGSLGAIHPLLGVGIALAALLVIAVALRPDLATLLFLVLLYSNAGAIAVQRDGLPFVIAAAFPALLLIPLAYHLVARREAIIVTPALRLIVVLFLWELLSTILSSDVSTSMERLGGFALEGVLLVAW